MIIKWFSIPRANEKDSCPTCEEEIYHLKKCLELSSHSALVTDVKNTKIPLKFNCFKIIIIIWRKQNLSWRKTTDGKFNTHNRCLWEREVKMLSLKTFFWLWNIFRFACRGKFCVWCLILRSWMMTWVGEEKQISKLFPSTFTSFQLFHQHEKYF